jgi:hypothetical protein
MKKIISLLSLVLFFCASCKDTYSCDCSVVTKEDGQVVLTSKSKKTLSEPMTEDQADASCDVVEKELEDNFNQQTNDPHVRSEASCIAI